MGYYDDPIIVGEASIDERVTSIKTTSGHLLFCDNKKRTMIIRHPYRDVKQEANYSVKLISFHLLCYKAY